MNSNPPRPEISARANLFIQMSGAPGSGKSTLAQALAQPLNAVIIDHDLLKSTILEDGVEFGAAAKLTYSLQWTLTHSLLAQKRSVIVDSCCNYREIIEHGERLASRFGTQYVYIECRAGGIEILEKRLKERMGMRSQRSGVAEGPRDVAFDGEGEGHGERERAKFQRWIDDPCRPEKGGIVVDTSESVESSVHTVLERIQL